jgi:hypothetical protein
MGEWGATVRDARLRRHRGTRRVALATIWASAALVLTQRAPTAAACATFGRLIDTGRTPSLSLERVLIVHDPVTQLQHFIREVVFRGDAEVFGFVVPTPSLPEVFAVEHSPFVDLEGAFPYVARPPQPRARTRSAGSGSVEVLEQKAVGSFTAFVLRASDPAALAQWLRDNQLQSTQENDAWLRGYVARDFYYVALRHERRPGTGRARALKAETMRISFRTPVAYYPYREPQMAASGGSEPRALALWLAAAEPLVPVAWEARGAEAGWVRPLREGLRASAVESSWLRGQLGSAERSLIAPDRRWSVQTFEDQKRSRAGFGDVVYLPEAGVAADARAEVAKFVRRIKGDP